MTTRSVSAAPAAPRHDDASEAAAPLRIVHVLAPAPVGGAESVVRLLATGHARRGHIVSIAATVDSATGEHPLLDALAGERGVSVHRIAVPGRAYHRERSAVRAVCAAVGADVAHSHGYRSDIIGAGGARALGVATVTTVHGFTGGDRKNRLYEWLQRRAMRRFDAVVAVSRALASTLRARGVPADRLRLIPNAFDAGATVLDRAVARTRLRLPDDAFVVGWVGRLGREKGADVLLDAVARLDGAVLTAIVGDGAERDALVAQAVALGIGDRVRWCGVHPDAGALFAAFDAFALSSRTEGIPIVLFEAMAAGVPIVATGVGGVPEVVRETDALLVPPEDPATLADALRRVRRDPVGAAARARSAARRLHECFALDPWLARYESLYRGVLHAGRPARGAR